MAGLVVPVTFFYTLLALAGIGCPLRWLTGISCAGCGMTRAWLCVLRLEFGAAWRCHPLFFMPPLAVVYLMFGKKHVSLRLHRTLAVGAVLLFLFVYAYRMACGGDGIVSFCPEEGIIMRGTHFLFGGIINVLS